MKVATTFRTLTPLEICYSNSCEIRQLWAIPAKSRSGLDENQILSGIAASEHASRLWNDTSSPQADGAGH